jgi:hypothetical protein
LSLRDSSSPVSAVEESLPGGTLIRRDLEELPHLGRTLRCPGDAIEALHPVPPEPFSAEDEAVSLLDALQPQKSAEVIDVQLVPSV